MFKNKKINQGLVIIGSLVGSTILTVCLVRGLIKFVNSTPAVKEAITLATTVKPETFTELYFEDHLNLPQKIKMGERLSFAFVVHNLEYKDFTYNYEVSAEDEEGKNKIVIIRNQFLLKHGETKTIPIIFGIRQFSKRMKITVNLVNKNQPIHFWVEQEGIKNVPIKN